MISLNKMSNTIFYSCSTRFDCNDDFAICLHGICTCKQGFFSYNGICVRCPDLGKSCEIANCCADLTMECGDSGYCSCRNGIENSITCSAQTPIYITASQIALSAALIMGMAALTMVVYRLCTKPRYLSARQRALASRTGANLDNESLSYANYLRASLTSMQIRVLTRLRDRPPTYETRQPTATLPEAPPPYDGATEEMSMPPAYTELVLSPTGYINSSFVDPDAGPVNRCTDSDSINNRNYNNSSVNTSSNCDKVSADTVDEKTETGDENRIPI